jgi:hypothetical protein
MRQYTPEEQAYWNLHNDSAFHEIHREIFEVKQPAVPSFRTSEHMESFIKAVMFPYCEEMRLRARGHLNKVRREVPPTSFAEFHSQWVSYVETEDAHATQLCALCRAYGQDLISAISAPFGEEPKRAHAAVEKWKEALNKELQRVEAAYCTHNLALNRAKSRIDRQLVTPSWLSTTKSAVPKPQSRGAPPAWSLTGRIGVTFRPAFIPVKIAVNNRGEVTISGETTLPTPVGTFSLEGEVKVRASAHELLIVQNGKRHVYSLGSDLYVFEVADFSGPVRISYDGKGGVTICLGKC